jgi:methylglyoxal/glyoxal reductase
MLLDIPPLGLGLFRIPPGETTEKVVNHALSLGYRHFDTAASYRNEIDVGRALKASGLKRKDYYITTKLPELTNGKSAVYNAVRVSLDRLGLDQVDICLLHWPPSQSRCETWEALRDEKISGLCRIIGVSNFERHHIEELYATGYLPEINQIETHPFLPQTELLNFCRQKGICVVAYAPLTRGARLDDPSLVKIANRLKITPAQLMLAWGRSRGTPLIVGAMKAKHMEENMISTRVVIPEKYIYQLETLNDGYRVSWDSSGIS